MQLVVSGLAIFCLAKSFHTMLADKIFNDSPQTHCRVNISQCYWGRHPQVTAVREVQPVCSESELSFVEQNPRPLCSPSPDHPTEYTVYIFSNHHVNFVIHLLKTSQFQETGSNIITEH